MPVSLEYPDLMLLEQCRCLFFSTTDGVKLELSDFIRFLRYSYFGLYSYIASYIASSYISLTNYTSRNCDLISDETFRVSDASILFNSLSVENQNLSFEGFVSALQEIPCKNYEKLSSRDKLKLILNQCKSIGYN